MRNIDYFYKIAIILSTISSSHSRRCLMHLIELYKQRTWLCPHNRMLLSDYKTIQNSPKFSEFLYYVSFNFIPFLLRSNLTLTRIHKVIHFQYIRRSDLLIHALSQRKLSRLCLRHNLLTITNSDLLLLLYLLLRLCKLLHSYMSSSLSLSSSLSSLHQ
jgi:hypothetical protein